MYPLTSVTWRYRGLRCQLIEVLFIVFFKFSADQLLAFNWSRAQIYIFQSYGFHIKLSIDVWSFQ